MTGIDEAYIGLPSCQVSRKSIQQLLTWNVRTDGRLDRRTDRADSKIPLRTETKWNNKNIFGNIMMAFIAKLALLISGKYIHMK